MSHSPSAPPLYSCEPLLKKITVADQLKIDNEAHFVSVCDEMYQISLKQITECFEKNHGLTRIFINFLDVRKDVSKTFNGRDSDIRHIVMKRLKTHGFYFERWKYDIDSMYYVYLSPPQYCGECCIIS